MQRTAPFVIVVLAAVAAVAFSLLVPAVSAEEPEKKGAKSDAMADGVVAIYFHGNVRCATCRKIEAYADEAVQSRFSEALERLHPRDW